jgi:hypothetical protein
MCQSVEGDVKLFKLQLQLISHSFARQEQNKFNKISIFSCQFNSTRFWPAIFIRFLFSYFPKCTRSLVGSCRFCMEIVCLCDYSALYIWWQIIKIILKLKWLVLVIFSLIQTRNKRPRKPLPFRNLNIRFFQNFIAFCIFFTKWSLLSFTFVSPNGCSGIGFWSECKPGRR